LPPAHAAQAARLRTFLGVDDEQFTVKSTMSSEQQQHVDLIVDAGDLAEIEKLPYVALDGVVAV
jgi:hypothetical protein